MVEWLHIIICKVGKVFVLEVLSQQGKQQSMLFWKNWHRHTLQQQRELMLCCSRSLFPRSHNRCFVTHRLNRTLRGQLFLALPSLVLKANQFQKREPEILQQGKTAATSMKKQQIKSNVFCILTDTNLTAEKTHVGQPWK